MAFVVKFVKGVRNNWKKSTFAACLLSYGVVYAKEKYDVGLLMRTYCKEAVQYGDMPLPVIAQLRSVTVILNPAANKRSSKDLFEKYCEPLFHLSGIKVNIIKTDSEGHARQIVESMTSVPDAILVAGGDGTLAETVTGLLRRKDQGSCVIGLLPLGRTNSVGEAMFPGIREGGLRRVQALANAAMAVVRGSHKPKDIIKVEVISEEDADRPAVYAVGSLQWGAYRDIIARRDKYWYLGPLRDYAAYVFNGYKDTITWNCSAAMRYSIPCQGCNNCCTKPNVSNVAQSNKRWWSGLIPSFNKQKHEATIPKIDYSQIINENCSVKHEMKIQGTELLLTTANCKEELSESENVDSTPKLLIKLGPEHVSYMDVVTEGWQRLSSNKSTAREKLFARTIELIPERISTESNESWFAIDNEEYEVKPIKVTLIPKAIEMFC